MILRPFKLSDAASVYQYAKNPHVGPIAGWPVHTSVADSRHYIAAYFMRPHIFAITLKNAPNHVIGLIGLELVAEGGGKSFMQPGTAEISYWLGEPFWGQGLAPEAIAAVDRYGFETLHLAAIWCGYKDGNEQSKRAQAKQGYRYDRTIGQMPNPYLAETIVEHFTKLTRAAWQAD
ncbi:hypothetical protein IV40_GL001652 [Lactobacillus selangorensis]|nr:hypothetical protein IV40_GL001652 [Lactobacillus selangorensis]